MRSTKQSVESVGENASVKGHKPHARAHKWFNDFMECILNGVDEI